MQNREIVRFLYFYDMMNVFRGENMSRKRQVESHTSKKSTGRYGSTQIWIIIVLLILAVIVMTFGGK